nr:hypothetical protein [Tanacetum cinerariifolium]
MGDEHLDTIPVTESDEFIKSCVENLVPNPSESEGENGCDVPACFTTFSNVFFDAEYEFDSVDDQSCSVEDFPEEIFSNQSLLNHDSSIIPSSSKIDSLLDEFARELTLLKSIPSRINKTDCYYENEIRLIERLLYDNSSPRPPEEIDLTFTLDYPMTPSIEKDDDNSERDILILKELPSNYSLSLPENESFFLYSFLFSSSCKTTRW